MFLDQSLELAGERHGIRQESGMHSQFRFLQIVRQIQTRLEFAQVLNQPLKRGPVRFDWRHGRLLHVVEDDMSGEVVNSRFLTLDRDRLHDQTDARHLGDGQCPGMGSQRGGIDPNARHLPSMWILKIRIRKADSIDGFCFLHQGLEDR